MPKGETSAARKGEKTKKRITVIDGVLVGEAPIFVIQSGNDFESIRGDKHITRITDRRLIGAAQPFFTITIEGTVYATPTLGLEYHHLMQLIKRGLALGDKLPKFDNAKHGGKFDIFRNTEMEKFRKSIPGEPDWGTPAWLINTDFQSEKDFLEASELGYFLKKDFTAGQKLGFKNAFQYFFGQQHKITAEQTADMVKFGIADLEDYNFTKKGGFSGIREANKAKKLGFKKAKIYQKATDAGFENKEQYDAVTKHKWEDLATYKEAIKFKFDIKEKQFYEKVKLEPAFNPYWNHIVNLASGHYGRDEKRQIDLIDFIRNESNMIEFGYEAGYEFFWQAEVLDYLRSAKGRSVAYEKIVEIALKPHPFQKTTESKVIDFLINDDEVNTLGRAIPRDSKFSFDRDRTKVDSVRKQ